MDRQDRLVAIIQESGCKAFGIKVSTRVCTGVPYVELIKEIKSQNPDLLVMGTKGRSNLVDTIIVPVP